MTHHRQERWRHWGAGPARQPPFIEQFEWEPDRGTRIVVLDRTTGDVVADPTTDPFGVSHVNAFEWDGGTDVVFDLETIPDATAIDSLYLDNIRAGEMGTMAGRIDRFAVDLGSATGAARYGVGTSRGSERPRESEPGPRSSGSRRERSIAVYRRTVAS